MKYFTFIDKDTFDFTTLNIWNTVLQVQAWPTLWKQVISVAVHSDPEINHSSKIDCYFTLFYFLNLHFAITLTELEKPKYASFNISGDFNGTGKWILHNHQNETLSTLHLHLQTHHFFLKFISKLPFGETLIQYSHRRVMLEGKKMILNKLSYA